MASGARLGPCVNIDAHLAARLVGAQFPQWAGLPVRPVVPGGWDNRTFRLGETMSVRLPSRAVYVAQIDKEQAWLPKLAPHLPLPVPKPIARGEPGEGYPWPWSVYAWLEGERAQPDHIGDLAIFARELAGFLGALQRIDASDGPPAGPHNFWRGGPLATYDTEAREALQALAGRIDTAAATRVWEAALASTWPGPPVWVHGDIAPGNLLVQAGRLSAVIDFGSSGVGDPACDLAIAWTLFEGESRTAFRDTLALDPDTWARARGWALWKALILLAGFSGDHPDTPRAGAVLDAVLADPVCA